MGDDRIDVQQQPGRGEATGGRALRILQVEDEPAPAHLMKEYLKLALREPYELTWVQRLSEAAQTLREQSFDLVLLDLGLPDSCGLETFLAVFNQAPHIPIIVLSSLDDEATALRALHSGAQDYLVKGTVDSHLLVHAVHYAIERKKAEAALRESEERFRIIFQGTRDGILLADSKTKKFCLANAAICQMLGYEAHELEALGVADLHPPADRPYVINQFERQVRKEITLAADIPVQRKDGSIFYADVNAALITIAGTTYLVGFFRDISERKQAAASLRRITQRLHQAQDEERRHLARELHDSTAQRLAALVMNLDLLDAELPPRLAKAAKLLSGAHTLANQCVQDVRNTAYLLHPPLLDQLGLVVALRDYVEGFVSRSGLQIALELAPEPDRLPPELELALYRVVQEGLSNVYRHSGGRTARIRLVREPRRVMLEVRDTGHGMPADLVQALLKGQTPVGVGLAGMRERLQLLNGELEIESNPNGTTLRAVLPLAEGAA